MNIIKKEIKKTVIFTYCIFFLLYFKRTQLYRLNNKILTFFLGVTPNLFPSFLFTVIVYYYFKSPTNNNKKILLLTNLSNLLIFVLIEYLHLLLNLGKWDNYDILASILGIIFGSLFITYKKTKLREV